MSDQIGYVRKEDAPLMPPPASEKGITGWLHQNVFASMSNYSTLSAAATSIFMILLTLFFGYALIKMVWMFLDFTIFSAVWSDPEGLKRELCNIKGSGMCWPFIAEWLRGLTYGNKYPIEELWRVQFVYVILFVGIAWLVWERMPYRKYVAIFMLAIFPIIAFVFLTGGPVENGVSVLSLFKPVSAIIGLAFLAFYWAGSRDMLGEGAKVFSIPALIVGLVFSAMVAIPLLAGGLDGILGLETVPTIKWGGLLVTLVVAITGIIFSLPIGVLLALGRQSDGIAIKWLSIAFIEIIRGIPLISVLFFGVYLLVYFVPSDFDFNKLLRVLIAVALFASAYMAEVIRGGLQAMPKGQYEGGMSLGLGYWQQMRLIILPQALTTVIPGIVNTFIGLFKDTTLVLIVSMFDLLALMELSAVKELEWAGAKLPITGYVFVGAVFWVFCFGMSRYSIHMERKLHRGH